MYNSGRELLVIGKRGMGYRLKSKFFTWRIIMEWRQLLCEDRIRNYKTVKSAGDLRTEFEKDYHRIIGSASFRRLQDKTQVFP